jgi:hypothetical protein
MKPNEPGLQASNDAEIARRALRLLAERRIVPTPDTFADAFWESAGQDTRGQSAAGVLKDMGADLVRQSRMSQQEATQMLQAAQRHHWSAVREATDRALARRVGSGADAWPSMALTLLRQADALHANWTRARKLDSIARVIEGAAASVPPGETLRVLMVIARPSGLKDVGYQMIARPLVERLSAVRGRVRLDVLRPPTLEAKKK